MAPLLSTTNAASSELWKDGPWLKLLLLLLLQVLPLLQLLPLLQVLPAFVQHQRDCQQEPAGASKEPARSQQELRSPVHSLELVSIGLLGKAGTEGLPDEPLCIVHRVGRI